MGVSGPGSGGRCPTAGAVMVCDDMALRERRREEQKLKFSLGRAVRGTAWVVAAGARRVRFAC